MIRSRSGRAATLAAAVSLVLPACGLSAEIKQSFPADKPPTAMNTQWRVVWGIERHGGGSEVLFVKEAYFQRGPAEPEIKVLDDCRLADIFVPYNNGTRIYDISGYHFTLVDLNKSALGPPCITPGRICNRNGEVSSTGPVAVEVHDGQVRWMNRSNVIRRGQSLAVWAVLDAANYRYIMLYDFRDDGVIGFRLGATAHNLNNSDDDKTTHLHSAFWRLNVTLGDSVAAEINKVSLKTETMPEKTVTEVLLNETGIRWVPEEFTRLRIVSRNHVNGHSPQHPISYELIPFRMGSARYSGVGEEFTKNDLWITKFKAGEIRPRDLPTYANNELLGNEAVTLWHQTPLLHVPRDEDFGKVGTNAGQGVAITTWAGCDLKPRNFFSSTPLYP